jgi:arsenate reductase
MMQPAYKSISAGAEDLPAIIRLLQENDLPTEDVDPGRQLFWVIKDAGALAGEIGLESWGEYGLLRSMATRTSSRNKGIATQLVNGLFDYAQKAKLKEIYLLTETAAAYFERRGFQKISREVVPEAVKQSKEFSHLCPSTAIVMKKPVNKKRILFVCVENSNRSQMSQAFANMLGADSVEAFSAGSKPSGIVNPKAIAAMKELGYDLGKHDSKSLKDVQQYAPFDAVVTMGCGDACPWMPAKKFIDWDIPDPRNMEPGEFNKVRDLIGEKVKDLLASL